MPLEGHIATSLDCYKPPIPPLLIPEPTVASATSTPSPRSFLTGMDEDLLPLYQHRLLSLFQPTTASPGPSASCLAASICPKLEEDRGSPLLLLEPGADFRNHMTQQQLQGLPPPLLHHHNSSFPPPLQLCDITGHVLDEMLIQRPDGESTTATASRASSVSMVGYEYEDDPEASCRTNRALRGGSSSLLAALGVLQHQRRHHHHHHDAMLHDSAVVAADSLLGLDAAALGLISDGAHSLGPSLFMSEEGAAATNEGSMMMGHCRPTPTPGFWTEGADNNTSVAAVGKRSRYQSGHTSEKQRRIKISEKFLALRSLLPNSIKSDKSSIIKGATDYVKELLRIVERLKLLIHRKHLSTLKEEPGGGITDTGLLRSSWVQKSFNGTFIDVRILEDEVNIKLSQQPRSGCLLLVAKGLLDMQLELLHLTSAKIGNNLAIFINAKIQVGSCVHATFIANKLVDAVNRN